MWKTVQKLKSKQRTNERIGPLKDSNGETVIDDTITANLLNKNLAIAHNTLTASILHRDLEI